MELRLLVCHFGCSKVKWRIFGVNIIRHNITRTDEQFVHPFSKRESLFGCISWKIERPHFKEVPQQNPSQTYLHLARKTRPKSKNRKVWTSFNVVKQLFCHEWSPLYWPFVLAVFSALLCRLLSPLFSLSFVFSLSFCLSLSAPFVNVRHDVEMFYVIVN